ncbi:MAG: DUF2341 domain-containing protein, partial [Candidatus Kariarchaeaceae archaeon]
MKKNEKLSNLLVLFILCINFTTTGIVLGGNILNIVNSQNDLEANWLDNSSSDDTTKFGPNFENQNNQGGKSYLIDEESRSSEQILNSKFKVQTWEKPDFEYRKNITIDSTKVSGSSSLSDFPILIDLYDPDLRTKVQSDGDDIIFTDGSGNQIPHEIERFNQRYNSALGHLTAWVKIPSLSPTIDTTITMYYGNSTIGTQENPTSVWDSNFLTVHHLEENPTGTISDSTANNNNMVGTNMDTSDSVDGHINRGFNFDSGGTEYLTSSTSITLQSFTFSLWADPQIHSNWDVLMNFDTAGINYRYFAIADSDQIGYDGEGNLEYFGSLNDVSENQWQYFVLTYDSSQMKGFLDGNQLGSAVSKTIQQRTDDYEIASYNSGTELFDGIIDEVRISNVSRSADWILTEYNNQLNPSNFYSIGSENNQTNWFQPDLMFRKTITIDSTKVNRASDFTDFPVLIELFDTDLKLKTQIDGDDIVFVDQLGKKLDHEIEFFDQNYNSTHAHLVTWVQVPKLFGTVDTNIFVYYGNSTIGNQDNPGGVWDNNSNYESVWHLSDDPTGILYDSTSNNYDGTSGGSMTSTDLVSGKIGEAIDFDGSNDYIAFSDPLNSNTMTISAWVYLNTASASWITIAMRTNPDSWFDWQFYARASDAETSNHAVFRTSDGSTGGVGAGSSEVESDIVLSTGNWYYLVGESNSSHNLFYTNGVLTETELESDPIPDSNRDFWIGANDEWGEYLSGILDEIRVSNFARSSDWISTEYNNQKDPSSFYDVSSEEVQTDWSFPDFQFRKKITVDNTKVSGTTNLFDFPMLIELYDNNLRTVVQPDGDDLLFADVIGNKLDHEIELFNQNYNNTHAHLVAWVRVSNILATLDTPITMYYGNSTIGNQENPTGVWNRNYMGVWHLGEPGGT